jgi:hypothetical protein
MFAAGRRGITASSGVGAPQRLPLAAGHSFTEVPSAAQAGTVGQAELAHGDTGDRLDSFSRGIGHQKSRGFLPAPSPSDADVAHVLATVCTRVGRLSWSVPAVAGGCG